MQQLLLSVASDDYGTVYLNGHLVDPDAVNWHEAAYWNRYHSTYAHNIFIMCRRIFVDTSILNPPGVDNVVSVVVRNQDQWAFFDLQLEVTYNPSLYGMVW